MNELLLFALLSATPPAADCCVQPPPTFTVVATDSKEAVDRVGHFVSPLVLTTSFYGTALYLGANRKQARWISAGLSVVLIVAKELYDESVAGRFGWEEVAIGAGGTAAGVFVAERIDWSR